MATYTFKCPNCKTVHVDDTRKFGDNAKPTCKCGDLMNQIIDANPFILKGSGWYKPGHH